MRLKGIYIAIPTARVILEIAQKQLAGIKSSKNGNTIPLDVRDQRKNETRTLHVTFYSLTKAGFLHGRTSEGEHVFIKLGIDAAREILHPSVVVSVKEITKSTAQKPLGSAYGNSKRR